MQRLNHQKSLSIAKTATPSQRHYFLIGDNAKILANLNSRKIFVSYYDVVYVDPPYNTGETKNKIYTDKFSTAEYYREIKERMQRCWPLINSSGYIAISIGIANLGTIIAIMNTIFGTTNLISIIPRATSLAPMPARLLAPNLDFVVLYAKNKAMCKFTKRPRSTSQYNLTDARGNYKWFNFNKRTFRNDPKRQYSIEHCGQKIFPTADGKQLAKKTKKQKNRVYNWTYRQKYFRWALKQGIARFKTNQKTANVRVQIKLYENLNYLLQPRDTNISYQSNYLIANPHKFTNSHATQNLTKIFNGENPFDYAKPVELIQWIINLHPNQNAKVLDFYAGSGTTAHATLELNRHDGGHREFTIINWAEANIHLITRERLVRIISGIDLRGQQISWATTNEPFRANHVDTFVFSD